MIMAFFNNNSRSMNVEKEIKGKSLEKMTEAEKTAFEKKYDILILFPIVIGVSETVNYIADYKKYCDPETNRLFSSFNKESLAKYYFELSGQLQTLAICALQKLPVAIPDIRNFNTGDGERFRTAVNVAYLMNEGVIRAHNVVVPDKYKNNNKSK